MDGHVVTGRRQFLSGLSAAMVATAARPAQASTDYRDVIFIHINGMNVISGAPGLTTLGRILSSATWFREGFAAGLTPRDEVLTMRSGRYPHQLGHVGAGAAQWDRLDSSAPALLNDMFNSIGYSHYHLTDDGTVLTTHPVGRRTGVIVEISVERRRNEPHLAPLRRLEARLAQITAQFDMTSRSAPLVAVVSTPSSFVADAWTNRRVDFGLAPPAGTGTRYDSTRVSSVDLVPTLLDWAGAEAAAQRLPGRSLLEGGQVGDRVEERRIYMSRNYTGIGQFAPIRAMRPSHFLIAQSLGAAAGMGRLHDDLQLFDLRRDPACRTNVGGIARYAAARTSLAAELREWRSATSDRLTLGHL